MAKEIFTRGSRILVFRVIKSNNNVFCLYHHPVDGGSNCLWDVGKLLQDVKKQKTAIFILAVVRTSYLRPLMYATHDAEHF